MRLSAVYSKRHINIVHGGGVWTTRASELVVMMDSTLVFIIRCFLLTPPMCLLSVKDKADTDLDSEYMKVFCPGCETADRYV